MSYIDRQRAQHLMQDAGLDALLILSPEGFRYVTGIHPGSASMWRRAGSAAAVVPADQGMPLSVIVPDWIETQFRASSINDVRTHPIWVDSLDVSGLLEAGRSAPAIIRSAAERAHRMEPLNRPRTFDARLVYAHLHDVLRERNVLNGRIGVESDFVSVLDFAVLEKVFPTITWIDASSIMATLRMIKSQAEIAHLRAALELTEVGMTAVRDVISEGETVTSLSAAFRRGVDDEVQRRRLRGFEGVAGSITAGPDLGSKFEPLGRGGLVKIDMGSIVHGYLSDSARTFTLGAPNPVVQDIFSALHAAWTSGFECLVPGRRLSDVHRAVTRSMTASGFATYSRGHYGHSVGSAISFEEWPFLAADSSTVIEPNMVMAFETPWYLPGIGSMSIEDQILITEDGAERMNTLSNDMQQLPF